MGQYTSYYLYQKYEKRGSQDWLPVYPNVFSVDAQGTMPISAKTEYDVACGYDPSIIPIYRWVNLPISTDYICDECPSVEPIYAWNKAPVSDYVCDFSTFTKYYKEYYQVSYDSGTTWENVVPVSSRTSSDVIEYNSEDCGYVACDRYKVKATYSDLVEVEKCCDSTSAITYAEINNLRQGYSKSDIISAIVGDCVTNISGYSHTEGNVTYWTGAFMECTSLSSITIPNSVTTIGYGSFHNCRSLTGITVPNSVTSIGDYAFNDCWSLTTANIPSGVTSVGERTFAFCSSLTGITIPSGVTSIGDSAFSACTGLLSVTFANNSQLTSIDDFAFYFCSGLTSITLPNNLQTIGSVETSNVVKGAFAYDVNLVNVDLPSSLQTIGDYTFWGCDHISGITIQNNVTRIGQSAFRGCNGMDFVTIGSGIQHIDRMAFFGCSGLTSITCLATTPPNLYNWITPSMQVLTDVFDDTNNCPIYVPSGSVNTYKSASGWSTYASRIQAIP